MLQRAFTLIELLIVVAIIAILAAIAVPNFLEAQTRSKVSRTQTDMRTIATGMESYAVDHNRYPPSRNWAEGDDAQARLTTPVSYLANLPKDVFNPDSRHLWYLQTRNPPRTNGDMIFIEGLFAMMTHPDAERLPFGSLGRMQADYFNWSGKTLSADKAYQIRSLGPAREDAQNVAYDPTNGTISVGNVVYFGPFGLTP
jgi:prepilin-type N-terminal cleavage/methylation domain-containing protein